MGVAPYKTFTFDGVSSSAYGVYITGEGVFNAPKRSVEMIEIPGRNGNYALDHGKFENIEVTYKCGMFDVTESNFATKVSNFRNWICSKVGYKRLTDEYNPNEYRMAVYKNGLDVDHDLLIAGEFEITFECKPQRWLTSGETETAVANNGTISNPTLFDARPTLKFQGYGDIGIGGKTISVASIPIGNVLLANSKEVTVPYPDANLYEFKEVTRHTIDSSLLNAGDDIYVDTTTFVYDYQISGRFNARVTSFTITSESGSGATSTAIIRDAHTASLITSFNPATFQKGTASTITHSIRYTMATIDELGGQTTYTNYPRDIVLAYDGANTITISADTDPSDVERTITGTANLGNADAYSTKQISGTITVDLDIGEAYWLNNNVPADANYAVSMGAELPVLSPGSNTITYDNTITSFKVIPNWWKV